MPVKVKILPYLVFPPVGVLQSGRVCGIVFLAYHILWGLLNLTTISSVLGVECRGLGTFLTKRFSLNCHLT